MISAIGSPACRPGRGFTLIELVVVLAILASLSMAFPMAMDRLQPERQLQVYAQRVASDLRQQRSEAMIGNRVAALQVAADAHGYKLEPEARVATLPGAIAIAIQNDQQPAASLAGVRFFPDGSSTGGTVQLTRGSHRAGVRVSALTGRVTVE